MKNIIIEPTKNICKECNKIKKYPIEEVEERFFCDVCGNDTIIYKVKK